MTSRNSFAEQQPPPFPERIARRAFSLVELVIVVVIIGVIAAIAVPRLSSGAEGAGESSLKANLTTLRNVIDRYAAEHNGVFPGALNDSHGGGPNSELSFLNQLTHYSSAAGACSDTAGSGFPFGPYLRAMPAIPVGPNKGEKVVAIDASNSPPLVTGDTEAWVYNPATGEIIANTDDGNADGTRTYDEY